jgi:hypothetical protein
MEKKRGYRRSAGDSFIPYMTTFFLLLGGDREAVEVEVALTTSIMLNTCLFSFAV